MIIRIILFWRIVYLSQFLEVVGRNRFYLRHPLLVPDPRRTLLDELTQLHLIVVDHFHLNVIMNSLVIVQTNAWFPHWLVNGFTRRLLWGWQGVLLDKRFFHVFDLTKNWEWFGVVSQIKFMWWQSTYCLKFLNPLIYFFRHLEKRSWRREISSLVKLLKSFFRIHRLNGLLICRLLIELKCRIFWVNP